MKKIILILLISFLIFPAFLIAQQTHIITQTGMTFEPSTLTVDVSDTVKWVWTEGTHTTTSTNIPNGAEEWDSPLTSSVTEFKYKVTQSGTYDYHCTPHQAMGMTGTFTAVILSDIEKNENDKIFVYPNPVKELMYINGINKKKVIIQIYNVAGLKLLDENAENINTFNLKNFDKGLYILSITDKSTNKVHIIKFYKN